MSRPVENEAVSSPDDVPAESVPRTSRRGRRTVLLAAVTVGVIGVASAGVVFAATANDAAPWDEAPLRPFGTPSLPLVQPERVRVPDVEEGLSPEELGHATTDAATGDWIQSLQNALRDDANFGSVAISEDRATVTIT